MEKGILIGQGRTADVYAWGSDRVLKLYQSWMPALPIEREFAITRAAASAGLSVPRADELLELEGRFGIVFEKVEGPSMLKVMESHPQKFIGISRQLAELHAHMHTCTLGGDVYTQRQQIKRGIEQGEGLTTTEKMDILDIFATFPEGEVICHGDFHPDNIILTDHGPVIIDWMTGTRGHPLGDVARTKLLLRTGGLPPRIPLPLRLIINASRSWIYSVYQREYLRLHPAGKLEIALWELPLLAARLFEVENYPLEKKMILKRIQTLLPKRDGGGKQNQSDDPGNPS